MEFLVAHLQHGRPSGKIQAVIPAGRGGNHVKSCLHGAGSTLKQCCVVVPAVDGGGMGVDKVHETCLHQESLYNAFS